MYECKTCGYDKSTTYPELLKHILDNKQIHPLWQVKWAMKKSCNAEFLNQKLSRREQFKGGKAPLTEREQENKIDAYRELSGQSDRVITTCTCGKRHMEDLPLEFIESPFAWRENRVLVVSCESCNVKSQGGYYH